MVQQLLGAGTKSFQGLYVCQEYYEYLHRLLAPILTRKSITLTILSLLFSFTGKSQQVTINDSIATLVLDFCNEAILSKIKFSELKFEKEEDRRVDSGFTGSKYYVTVLKISSEKTLTDQFLYIDNTSLDIIQFYEILSNGSAVLRREGGRTIPYQKQWEYEWHTTPINVGPSPKIYAIVMQAKQKNINFQYTLQSHKDIEKTYDHYDRVVFFYLGIAFMISAIILLAFFIFKQKVFALYFGYMLFVSVWIIDHYGKLFPNLYPNTPIINEISKPVSSLGACLLLLMVQQLIFKNNLKDTPRLVKVIKYLQTFLITQLLLSPLFLFPAVSSTWVMLLNYMWHAGFILSISLISFIPLHFIKSGPLAKIFSLAMLVISLTALIQLLGNFGHIKNYFINEHGMAFASILENSIMAFGLFYGLFLKLNF